MAEVLLNFVGEGKPHSPRRPLTLVDLDSRLSLLQSHSLEHSTRLQYASGLRDYLRFCLIHKLPFEPTPLTLARYIAYTSLFIASGPKYLSGARHYLLPIFPDFVTNRSHPLVQSTIAGARKIRGDPIRRKSPLRTSHLVAFLRKADLSTDYDDFLFATILSCAFYACHRIGELILPNSRQLWDWRKIIKRASLTFPSRRAQYRLPYHKTDRFFRGTDILFTSQQLADPVDLLHTYISWRDSLHGAKAALFIRRNGQPPTRRWFEHHLFSHVDRTYGGHSARAGGATFYASLGLSDDIIQALGRWNSSTWTSYIRDNPSVRAENQIAHLRYHPHLSSPPPSPTLTHQ
jgi:hypothetical protein